MSHIGRQKYFLLVGLLVENRDLGLKVRGLDVGDEAPLEAAP